MNVTRSICFLVASILSFVEVTVGDEVCQTYAGGAVYPRETGKSSGHSLQWTKAMSMFCGIISQGSKESNQYV